MKSLHDFRHLSLRKITLSSFRAQCHYKPKADEGEEKLKHKFVPCCDMLMTKIENLEPVRVNPEWPQPKVVIIGAGMAGLSAAAALIHGGISNLVILEAKNRTGGRIHSCKLGDVIVELGADYIEGGCVANPVYNLACIGRVLLCAPKRYSRFPDQYVTTEGRSIMPSQEIYRIMKKCLHDAASLFTSKRTDLRNKNLYDFLKDKLSGATDGILSEDKHDFHLVVNGLLNQIRARWGDDLTLVSLEQYGSNIFVPGGLISIPRGSQSLLEPLLNEIPNACFKLNKPVQSIRWGTSITSEPRAVVLCCDGTEVCADYVISTVSLGVMKEQADTLFSPNLPDYKKLAINCLGFGHVNKIFTEYAKPFWVKNQGAKLKIAWTTEQLSARNNWVKGISQIEEIGGRGNVLMCTVSGKEAIWTENISDSQLAEELTVFLRKVTGDPTIPCPTNINRSKWASDVHFYGSRTYMKLDSISKHLCDLAVPLPGVCYDAPPVLLFAGEATCPGHFSTMNGARASGIREAYRIIGLTIRFKGPPKHPTITRTKIPPCESPDSFSTEEEIAKSNTIANEQNKNKDDIIK